MIDSLGIEVGPAHGKEHGRAICRIIVNGERRGKMSLTRWEAIALGAIIRDGCDRNTRVIKFDLVLPRQPVREREPRSSNGDAP